jgi:transposase-like protein
MQMNQDPTVKRGRRSRVSTEQKLAILQQWQAGTPVVELCRTHSLKANAIYRWKKQLDSGLRDTTNMRATPIRRSIRLNLMVALCTV